MKTARAAIATFLFGGVLSVAAPAPAACAAEGPHAVLVVDTERSAGQHRYCVALDQNEVSGIRVIELAHDQHGLDYRLGYGGNAVCVLAGVGYESDECLKEGPAFWGYWRGDGSGGWQWSSTGANATVVEDGDVEGWSWGTGNDGSSHPQPPRTTFGSVCDEAEPTGQKEREKKGSDSSSEPIAGGPETIAEGSAGIERESSKGDARKTKDRDSPRRKKKSTKNRDRVAMNEPPSPIPEPSVTVASEPTADETGPPAAAWVVVGAAVFFVGGGVVFRRRRPMP